MLRPFHGEWQACLAAAGSSAPQGTKQVSPRGRAKRRPGFRAGAASFQPLGRRNAHNNMPRQRIVAFGRVGTRPGSVEPGREDRIDDASRDGALRLRRCALPRAEMLQPGAERMAGLPGRGRLFGSPKGTNKLARGRAKRRPGFRAGGALFQPRTMQRPQQRAEAMHHGVWLHRHSAG